MVIAGHAQAGVAIGGGYGSKVEKTAKRVLYGGGGQADWQKWAQAAAADPYVMDLISQSIQQFTGGVPDELTSEDLKNLTIHAYNLAKAGKSGDAFVKGMKAYGKATAAGKAYTSAKTQFKNSVKKQLGKQYDSAKWTSAALDAEFNENYAASGGDAATAVDDTVTVMQRDFTEKVDAGIFDVKGNKLMTDVDTAAEDFDITTFKSSKSAQYTDQIGSITDRLGISDVLSQEGKDYYAKQIQEGADPYEIEQILKASPEYLKLEFDKLYAQTAESLPDFLQEELAEIGIIDKQTAQRAQEFFNKDIVPVIRAQVAKLGGRGNEFAANAMAKAAADIEKDREQYTQGLESQARLGDIQRRRDLEAGRFEQAKQVTQYGAEQGSQAYINRLNEEAKEEQAMASLNLTKRSLLSKRALERQQRDIEKRNVALMQKQKESIAKANKYASKFGLFSNVLQGVAMGAATGGPVGALFGGAAGAGVGYLQQQQAKAYTAQNQRYTSPYDIPKMDYSKVGAGGQDVWSKYKSVFKL